MQFSHPDKVKLTANLTIEAVEARFVEITKAYKAYVSHNNSPEGTLNKLPTGLLMKLFVQTGNVMAILTAVKKFQWVSHYQVGSSRARIIFGSLVYMRSSLVAHFPVWWYVIFPI